MKILETKNLKKSFGGVRAVDGVSIHIPEGKITGLIGPNGSGKTTFINLISGMTSSDGGKVAVLGAEREKILPWENPAYGITRTFQQVRIFEQMSALDNLLVVLTEREPFSAIFEKHNALHIARAEEILKRLGIWEKKSVNAEHLSYGQRKLLEIGRALAMDAKIILFDEPFAGLFPEMVKFFSGVMKEMRDSDKTIILVEHDMNVIRELCDNLIVMDAGQILAEGNPLEVLARKEVIEAYLGE